MPISFRFRQQAESGARASWCAVVFQLSVFVFAMREKGAIDTSLNN